MINEETVQSKECSDARISNPIIHPIEALQTSLSMIRESSQISEEHKSIKLSVHEMQCESLALK